MKNDKISFDDLKISLEEVLKDMGYQDESPISYFDERTRFLLIEAPKIVVPRFSYIYADGIIDSDKIFMQGVGFDVGKIIARQLRKSEKIAIFIVTAGNEFQEWTQQLKEDPLDAYIADALGNVIAEKVADRVEESIEEDILEKGWLHTNRYSPGYCGWHVNGQQKLFDLFPEKYPCGVRLSKSSLMTPIKSISGIIGLGKDVRKMDYTCGLCSMEQCYKRKNK